MRPWSISALKAFENCPRRFLEVNVQKNFREPENDAMRYGNRIHKAIENYFKGEDPSSDIQHLIPILNAYRVDGCQTEVEKQMALTSDLEPCAWFSKKVWVRGAADLLVINGDTALVVDWKTGKWQDSSDQAALMALLVFCYFPDIDNVNTHFVWLKGATDKEVGDLITPKSFSRENAAMLWSRFTPREQEYQRAVRENDFPPRHSGLCRRHCVVSTCPYHGE